MVQFRLRRQQRQQVRSRWARHRRAGPRGPWAGRGTKVVGNLQDNSHRRPIGNLSSKVSGNLLRVREVDIVIQEGNQLCTSRITDFLNGQGHRRLRSGPAIRRTGVLQIAVAPSDAQNHALSVASSACSR